jgi:hypothetical protein
MSLRGHRQSERQRRPSRALAGAHRILIVTLLVAFPALAAAAAGTEPRAAATLADRPLVEALRELRAAGLNIIYTTNVVRPQMRVAGRLGAAAPRAALDDLLAPHGLEALDGPNQTIVIVPRMAAPAMAGASAASSAVIGTVRSRRDATPVAGVSLRLAELARATTSAGDGSFTIADVAAGSHTLEVRRRGFVVERLDGVLVQAGRPTRLAVLLDPAPIAAETLVVTPSRLSLLREEPQTPLALSREEIFALPHLGDDPFRALTLLPGVGANDVTAQFHVRGGRRDETQILLDGQELYDSYHLEDFDSALSVVAAKTLDSIDLSTGGFPVENGDRMSGVLDMTTATPTGPRRTSVGLSILNAHLGSSGAFHDQRGSWMAHARRGSIDLASQLLGPEKPKYWDAFGKLDYQLTPGQSLRANFLHSDDELRLVEVVGDESKRVETDYRSTYGWATHQVILGARLLVATAASRSEIAKSRRAVEIEEDVSFTILDRRDTEVLGLRQNWNLQVAPRHSLKWGFELRDFATVYDYRGTREFDNPLARLRDDQKPATRFESRLEEGHDSAYLAGRSRLGEPLTLELGVRWDKHSLTHESRLSPRLNLAWAVGSRSVLRASLGRFNQSQRPYELQVEDGETEFNPIERSDSRVLGFEHLFAGPRGLALRVEAYQREVSNPLPRWENLYEPINKFPEVEPDRVRITPDRALAEGVELFLRGRFGDRLGWWVNYTWSSSEDEIGPDRFPRSFDQTHALNLDLDWRVTSRWTLNLAWRAHTGWPTTPLSLVEETGDDGATLFVPVAGRRFSARLPTYHRLDLRASRGWALRAGTLGLFIDVQNAYDRGNVAGFDFVIDEEEGTLMPNPEQWAGILPSLGLSFEF